MHCSERPGDWDGVVMITKSTWGNGNAGLTYLEGADGLVVR